MQRYSVAADAHVDLGRRGVVRHRSAGKADDALTVAESLFRVLRSSGTVASSPSSGGIIALPPRPRLVSVRRKPGEPGIIQHLTNALQ